MAACPQVGFVHLTPLTDLFVPSKCLLFTDGLGGNTEDDKTCRQGKDSLLSCCCSLFLTLLYEGHVTTSV